MLRVVALICLLLLVPAGAQFVPSAEDEVAWSIGWGHDPSGPPVLWGDGVIVWSADGNVSAYEDGERVRWLVAKSTPATPAIFADQMAVLESSGIVSLSPREGSLSFRDVDGMGTPAAGLRMYVIVPGAVAALGPDLAELWSFAIEDTVQAGVCSGTEPTSVPQLVTEADGTLLVASDVGNIYGLSGTSGDHDWTARLGGTIFGLSANDEHVLVRQGGSVSLLTLEAAVDDACDIALHAPTWTHETTASRALLTEAGVAIVDTRLRMLSLADGTELWNRSVSDVLSIAAAGDGVLVSTDDGVTYHTEDESVSLPWPAGYMVVGEQLFHVSLDGVLRAIDEPSIPLPTLRIEVDSLATFLLRNEASRAAQAVTLVAELDGVGWVDEAIDPLVVDGEADIEVALPLDRSRAHTVEAWLEVDGERVTDVFTATIPVLVEENDAPADDSEADEDDEPDEVVLIPAGWLLAPLGIALALLARRPSLL